ncbi:hypothetical protein FOMPIDRAFT_1056037 [Fomitopsis schrenkii]|uniref:BTB domain-containing protein n=1 Tax=Fomitopsis schrenkii TaxID=2126942 RepID=S8EUN5_FOMSC|nr:hypothetical protein FOMPIDRAFT_1056037 [Fomitopsis schrenkii]
MSAESLTKRPPRKRARHDTSDSDSKSSQRSWRHIAEDKQFWYDDGNIIIIAQNIAFRLYRGLLASESEVLRDILTGDTVASSEHVLGTSTHPVDGCPIVLVTDRAAERLSFLSVLIHGRQYMGKVVRELDDIVNCIRLARKYRIEDLLNSSRWELEKYIPPLVHRWGSRVRCEPPAKAIMVANVIQSTHLSVFMLIMAQYQCCQLSSAELVKGFKHADGMVERLSPGDLELCIDAKVRLSARYVQAYNGLFDSLEASEQCETRQHCKQVVADVRRIWGKHTHADTLTGLLDFNWGDVVNSAKNDIRRSGSEMPNHDFVLCTVSGQKCVLLRFTGYDLYQAIAGSFFEKGVVRVLV